MGNPFRLRIIADATPTMPPGIPVEAIRWSLEGEAAAIDGMHVGVAPLPDDPWTRGKCGLKALQYMAAGVATVAEAVGANREVIEHGHNGFLAATAGEWIECVGRLVDNVALRAQLAAAGRRTVEERYSMRRSAEAFEVAVRDVGRRSVEEAS